MFALKKTKPLLNTLFYKTISNFFVSKYKLFLPTEEELRIELEREKQFLRLQSGEDDEKEDF